MTFDPSKAKIYICPGHTDLRKAVNGLSGIIEGQMSGKPFSGNIYLFCNRERKLLKAVWWDNTGFWLSQKRLEEAKYPWPETSEKARELNAEELKMLLDGIDFFKAHKKLKYKNIL